MNINRQPDVGLTAAENEDAVCGRLFVDLDRVAALAARIFGARWSVAPGRELAAIGMDGGRHSPAVLEGVSKLAPHRALRSLANRRVL